MVKRLPRNARAPRTLAVPFFLSVPSRYVCSCCEIQFPKLQEVSFSPCKDVFFFAGGGGWEIYWLWYLDGFPSRVVDSKFQEISKRYEDWITTYFTRLMEKIHLKSDFLWILVQPPGCCFYWWRLTIPPYQWWTVWLYICHHGREGGRNVLLEAMRKDEKSISEYRSCPLKSEHFTISLHMDLGYTSSEIMSNPNASFCAPDSTWPSTPKSHQKIQKMVLSGLPLYHLREKKC